MSGAKASVTCVQKRRCDSSVSGRVRQATLECLPSMHLCENTTEENNTLTLTHTSTHMYMGMDRALIHVSYVYHMIVYTYSDTSDIT